MKYIYGVCLAVRAEGFFSRCLLKKENNTFGETIMHFFSDSRTLYIFFTLIYILSTFCFYFQIKQFSLIFIAFYIFTVVYREFKNIFLVERD